ncbi:MAG TPA: cytochrome c, partial [Promineifilum sp.]|nr:cytochrome c [Promineifilum sp.]
MKRVLKVLGIIVVVLAAVVIILGVGVYVATQRRINKVYAIDVPSLTIPTDAASIEEGHRLTVIRGCIDCHGEDYGGGVFLDAPMVATIYAANLTTG